MTPCRGAYNLTLSTYRSHENGNRPLTESAARNYAKPLGVRWLWLWRAEGPAFETEAPEGTPAEVAEHFQRLLEIDLARIIHEAV